MKTLTKNILPLLAVASALCLTTQLTAQTVVFNDTFGSSTLNGTSTPGGTPSASSTSYDVASTKTGACTISGSKGLLETISSATTAGYVELQALFTTTPAHLVNVGDSINLTMTFTNTANLIGGSGSQIDVGLYNSGGYLPVAGSLNGGGLNLTSTNYGTNNCQWWQGYVAEVSSNTVASTVYTRPQQVLNISNAVQDLIFSGVGTGLYKYPAGSQIGSSLTSTLAPLTTGGKYTLSFTITITGPGTTNVTIVNNLYSGTISGGTLISAQTNTTTGGIGGTTYTNYANLYDGLAIGIANKGPSLQPEMTISQITISTNYYFAPVIAGLTNETIIAGNNLTLSPTVSANPGPAIYQWQTNGVNVGGATSASLAVNGVQYSQNGYVYSLIASNLVGLVTNSMTLTVIVTPSISGLSDQAVSTGTTATLNPTVSGVPTPSLQWQYNGANLTDGVTVNGSTVSGSASNPLLISNAQSADSGTYSLIASNSAGIVTNSMYLTIGSGDVLPILTGPTNITVIQGNNGTFSGTASGLPVPTLQWLDQTGTPITGATNNTLVLSNVQYSQNGYAYSLVASNSVGSVTNSATLTVIVPPAITTQPASLTVTNTQAASFTVVATGVPAPTYQWYQNGNPISSAVNSSATNATLTITSAAPTNSGNTFYVVISNSAGTTNSATVTLVVNSAMSATAFTPANGATGLCYDTPLTVTFNSTINLGTNGSIKLFNVTNSTTPVDTINVASGAVQQRTFPGDGQSFSYQTISISGSTAVIYPHFNVMSSNATYYVTIDNGAFKDSAGANFAGITATNVWQFSTKVGGPVNPTNPVVNLNGGADFLTVQGAVNSIPGGNTTPAIISIQNGIYTEIVDIAGKNNVIFRGQSRLGTLVGYPNNATFQAANGGTTHARMAFKVNANNIALDNLTVTNMTPQGGSQAEALMIETSAQGCIVNNCDIVSRQDTILANTLTSQAYFYNSAIRGNYDFIWGGGNLYFDTCTIDTIAGVSGANFTAARTTTNGIVATTNYPWANPSGTYTGNGMSFVKCSCIAEVGAGPVTMADGNGSAGELVSWYGCSFATNYVSPSSSLFSGDFIFWQDQNTSNGVPVTYLNVTTLSGSDARLLAATNIPTWLYGWVPQLAPNILTNPVSETVNYSSNATFTVAATGVPTPTYQWQHAGTNLPTATGATLTISGATSDNAGSYAVIVTTPAGSVTSATASLTVNPPPTVPPVFTAPPSGTNITINVGVNLAVSCTATDSDTPAQTLTYSLLAGPSGSAVDSGSGNFTWRPNASQASSVNSVQVVVTDNGTPNLSATNSFSVTVNPLTAPTTASPSYSGGQFSVSISGQVGPDYELQGTTNLIGGVWTSIATTNSPATMPVILTDPNAGTQPQTFYRIIAGPPLP